ncbi:MAG: aminodeoxychorismate/anthranilate synthase component II [Methanomicrobiales archaeon]|nr:aminodeoxychorismate/anthranilate synthase component II [Methanomicrobiales archaeon]MDI6875669.1 aminodeoxychorismate/anthranilate synthase component II [Methanomicrobiales archaeon]
MRVLIVDCYDSFTFNLYQQVGTLGARPIVIPNDTPFEQVEKIACDRIILSPGPGRPEDAGVCLDILDRLSRTIPTLGVCLGHQAIYHAFGGEVTRASRLMHGKTSRIHHDGRGIFSGVKNPFVATRYHSLAAEREGMPDSLRVTAVSPDDGCVMGVRHRRYPIEGIQFHPESILSEEGDALVRNFLTGEGRP